MGKAFEKQIKTIEGPGKKQVEDLNTLKSNNQLTIEDVIPKNVLHNHEAKIQLDKVSKIEKNVDRDKLIYETIETFSQDIYEGKITIKEADEYQVDLFVKIMNFKKNAKPRSQEKKYKKKKLFLKTCITFGRVEKKLLMLLKAKYF